MMQKWRKFWRGSGSRADADGPAAQDWTAEEASAALRPHAGGGTCDLVADIARPYACRVMARFLGVSLTPGQIKDATEAFFHLFAPITDAQAFAQVNDGIETARARLAGAPGSAGGLIAALRGKGLDEATVIDMAYLVLADGIENIEAACAMVFDIFQSNGLQIKADASLELCVREAMRLSSPAQILPRVAREACELHGVPIAAGAPVFLALGSANLDPQAHADPQVFRPERPDGPLLMFGRGRHVCIGAALAQLQVTTLMAALGEAGATRQGAAPLSYVPRFGHRWPQSCQITL